jgi:hypothetical protein
MCREYIRFLKPFTAAPTGWMAKERRLSSYVHSLSFLTVSVHDSSQLMQDEFLGKYGFAKLRMNRSSGLPALYQPITLLWAISRADALARRSWASRFAPRNDRVLRFMPRSWCPEPRGALPGCTSATPYDLVQVRRWSM